LPSAQTRIVTATIGRAEYTMQSPRRVRRVLAVLMADNKIRNAATHVYTAAYKLCLHEDSNELLTPRVLIFALQRQTHPIHVAMIRCA